MAFKRAISLVLLSRKVLQSKVIPSDCQPKPVESRHAAAYSLAYT